MSTTPDPKINTPRTNKAREYVPDLVTEAMKMEEELLASQAEVKQLMRERDYLGERATFFVKQCEIEITALELDRKRLDAVATNDWRVIWMPHTLVFRVYNKYSKVVGEESDPRTAIDSAMSNQNEKGTRE